MPKLPEKELPSKGVCKCWTPGAEEKYERLLAACNTFAERHLVMSVRDHLKYDEYSKEAKRAIAQARLRLATATDEELEELSGLLAWLEAQVSADEALEDLKAVRARMKEEGINLQVANGASRDARKPGQGAKR